MSLYTPVKYSLMIILLIALIMVILNLAPELNRRGHTDSVVMMTINIIVLVIGLVGSYKDNRQLLLTFAIILIILVIFAVVRSQAVMVVGNAVLDIVAILLSVYQSEMIRSGDM